MIIKLKIIDLNNCFMIVIMRSTQNNIKCTNYILVGIVVVRFQYFITIWRILCICVCVALKLYIFFLLLLCRCGASPNKKIKNYLQSVTNVKNGAP